MQQNAIAQQTVSNTSIGAKQSTLLQIASAAILGIVMLYGVGFASMGVAHNAAHDARHAFAFPCH